MALFSFVLLGLAFMFGNVSVKSFEEIGNSGGELVLGRLVVTDFIQNDFSLWISIISFVLFLCFFISSIIFFSCIFPIHKKNKNAVII